MNRFQEERRRKELEKLYGQGKITRAEAIGELVGILRYCILRAIQVVDSWNVK